MLVRSRVRGERLERRRKNSEEEEEEKKKKWENPREIGSEEEKSLAIKEILQGISPILLVLRVSFYLPKFSIKSLCKYEVLLVWGLIWLTCNVKTIFMSYNQRIVVMYEVCEEIFFTESFWWLYIV